MRCSGCAQEYCPKGADTNNDDEESACTRSCNYHEYFCKDSCESGPSSEKCRECKEECKAACLCPDFCQPLTEDAARCVEQGGSWDAHAQVPHDFNNIFWAFITLLEISTTEGWVDVMYAAVDNRGAYQQPSRDKTPLLWVPFFVIFIFFGTMFILNLCVGVIVDNFDRIKRDNSTKSAIMGPEQERWLETQRAILMRPAYFPLKNLHLLPPLRRKLYWFALNPKFECFILSCIVVNSVCLASKIFPTHLPEDIRWSYSRRLQTAEYFFAVVFTFECAVKIGALRREYWKDRWNKFDAICVALTIAGLILSFVTPNMQFGSVMSVIRLFRIARLLRLIRFAKGLNRLFTSLWLSIPKLLNVFLIMLLMLVLFSILGVQLFARVQVGGRLFRNFYHAFLTLLRSLTGESWNYIMHELARGAQYYMQEAGLNCSDPELLDPFKTSTSEYFDILNEKCLVEEPNGCGTPEAYAYFIAYTVLVMFIMLNLVIAVILEGYEDGQKDQETEVINKCIELWPKYDPYITCEIELADLFTLLDQVAVSFQSCMIPDMDEKAMQTQAALKDKTHSQVGLAHVPIKYARILDVRLTADKKVLFQDATKMAVRMVVTGNDQSELVKLDNAMKHLKEMAPDRFKRMQAIESKVVSKNGMNMKDMTDLSEQVAASKIQALFKRRREAREARKIADQKRQGKRAQAAAHEGGDCAAPSGNDDSQLRRAAQADEEDHREIKTPAVAG